jgi:flagellar protein FlaJ
MVYKFMPKNYQEKVKNLLLFSGSSKSPKGFVNYVFSFSFAIGFIMTYFMSIFYSLPFILFVFLWIIVFFVMFALFHGFLIIAIDHRTSFVESILPDALQLMAANSRAGYMPSRALMMSARPEFGPLTESIKTAGKEMALGTPVRESLRHIYRNIKSETLERTIKMISEGIRSGGDFASLLEENANGIRRVQIIKKEMKANVLLYIIFIFFAGAICAPILYSLSGFLIQSIGGFGEMANIPESAMGQVSFISFSGLDITPGFLFLFSLGAILITTVFSGLIIGLIGTGKERAGIKYIPILTILSLLVYFMAGGVISTIFGVMLPGA